MLMISMLMMMIFMIIFCYFLISLNFIVSMKMNQNFEKLTPFECGYDAFEMHPTPFSIHFFLICLLFLLFDLEISLILPGVAEIDFIKFKHYYTILWILFILFIGTIIEFKEGAFNWTP